MSDGMARHRTHVHNLGVAFLVTGTVAFLGMRWNMLEPQWAFPAGTKVMLVAAAVVSALVRMFRKTPPRATILAVGGAVPAGAFIAIVFGMMRDPTSQNLWPVGLAVLAAIAVAVSSLGTVVGGVVLGVINASGGNSNG